MTAEAAAPHRRTVSPETQRLYALDWAVFEAWCMEKGQGALPADPATVAGFLAAGGQSLSAGALGRRAASRINEGAKSHKPGGRVSSIRRQSHQLGKRQSRSFPGFRVSLTRENDIWKENCIVAGR
jgi:hypothetical protein